MALSTCFKQNSSNILYEINLMQGQSPRTLATEHHERCHHDKEFGPKEQIGIVKMMEKEKNECLKIIV